MRKDPHRNAWETSAGKKQTNLKKMKELTRAEEQIMQVLWDLEKAFVKEILQFIECGASCQGKIVRFNQDYYYEHEQEIRNFINQLRVVNELKEQRDKRDYYFEEEYKILTQ